MTGLYIVFAAGFTWLLFKFEEVLYYNAKKQD